MNFKTPFKVLTTAALIGTLSLSAVAPSASAATNTEKTSVSQKAATTIENVVFKTADGQYLTLTPSEYLDAKEAGVDFSKLELVAVQADNKSYSKEDYLDAKEASQNDPAKAFELLAKTEGAALEITTAPAVIEKDENGNFVVKPGTPAVDEDFKVTEIAAINPTTVKVNFSKAAESLDKADVTVTDKDGAKKYVKSVTLSEDKKSATVEFYDALTDGEYKVAVKDAGEATLKLAIGEPAKIEVANQTVNADGDKLVYKVYDASGLDITDSTEVKVSSNVAGKFTASKGQIASTLTSGSAFVELSYTKKDGSVVKADRITVKAEAAAAKTIDTNWTLKETGATVVNYTDADYKQDAVLNLGTPEFLDVTFKDQFGKVIAPAAGTVKYESLDTSKAIVDETTGKVTPRAEGTAAVKVSLLDADNKVIDTKTVELEVKATAKLAEIKADALTVTTIEPQVLKYETLNQFGDAITAKVTEAKPSDTDVATVAVADGVVTVTGKKEGTVTVTLTSGTVKTDVTVTVQKPGEVADYKVEGFQSELLVKDVATTDVDETTQTLSVKEIDAKGVVAGTVAATNVKVSLKDAEGKELTTTSTNTLATVSTLLSASGLADEKGPFTLTLKVGDLTVFSETFKVTDNRVAPKYSIKSNDLTVSENNKLNDAITAALEFEKTAAQTITVTDVDFASSNEKVIVDADNGANQGKDTTTEDGKTKIYVDSVTVTVAETGKDTETFTLDFKGEAFNVTTTKDQLAVDNAAAGVPTITAPAANASSLTLPTVIGYTVAIAASSNQQVIGLDGKILPPAADTDVKLKLKLTNTTTNKSATTGEITVAVPAATQVVLGADSLGTTDNEKVTVTTAQKYKVVATTAAGVTTTFYVKDDGTLTTTASEVATLTGTEITGLTNGGVSYVISKVE